MSEFIDGIVESVVTLALSERPALKDDLSFWKYTLGALKFNMGKMSTRDERTRLMERYLKVPQGSVDYKILRREYIVRGREDLKKDDSAYQ